MMRVSARVNISIIISISTVVTVLTALVDQFYQQMMVIYLTTTLCCHSTCPLACQSFWWCSRGQLKLFNFFWALLKLLLLWKNFFWSLSATAAASFRFSPSPKLTVELWLKSCSLCALWSVCTVRVHLLCKNVSKHWSVCWCLHR